MNVAVKQQLHPLFGAELTGLKITGAVTEAERVPLLEAVYKYGVVLVRGQMPSQAGLGEFAKSLGPIWGLPSSMVKDAVATLKETPGLVYQYTNRRADGTPMSSDDPAVTILKNNECWHTDSPYTRPRPRVSIFAGRVVPPEGANTEFCDTRVAFESLNPDFQEKLRHMTAVHSIVHGLSRIGRGDQIQGEHRDRYSHTERPLVEFHSESRRYALVLAHYIAKIDGMSGEDSESLLSKLMGIATQPSRVYSHLWSVGDILLWDNRCTMHRATPFDSDRYLREMWTIRTEDQTDMVAAQEEAIAH
jgi:alpha-ketoglutarate-dependent 2,4-dichlorophenoxyacetate dioxygenase